MARSFTPQFSHTMDFPCNLLWTEANNEALSLAEILEQGQLKLEVWHQVPGLASGRQAGLCPAKSQNLVWPEIYLKIYVCKSYFTVVYVMKFKQF